MPTFLAIFLYNTVVKNLGVLVAHSLEFCTGRKGGSQHNSEPHSTIDLAKLI